MRVCLVGNPNSGKSTLFNLLTHLNQKVGNYPGVTVDKQSGHFKHKDKHIELIDLPGTYSLFPRSLDESIVFNTLLDKNNPNFPDITVIVVNAGQLRRSLILATQLIDLGLPCLLALNMIDETTNKKISISEKELSKNLGIPVISISATKGIGIQALKNAILEHNLRKSDITIALKESPEIIEAVGEIIEIENNYKALINLTLAEKSRNISASSRIKLLALRDELNFKPNAFMAKDINARFKFINDITKTVIKQEIAFASTLSTTEKIDKILTHKWLGLPIAMAVLFIIFQALFSFANYPMDIIENAFTWLGDRIADTLPVHWSRDLLVDGVLAGLAGVLIFIPQIAILFGLLAILEGSGYMARISYITDRAMRRFGLSGKAVVPMMSGFACAIPAIMATRTIKSWKERLITIMVTPLLSCSARLPVYILLIGLLVSPKDKLGIFNLQGLTMMAFYLLGLILALLIAGLLSTLLRVKEQNIYVAELPRYRFPQWRNVLFTMFQKAKIFAIEAGKVILVISIALWFLASYGPKKRMQSVELKYEQLANGNELSKEQQQAFASEKLTNSYAGIFGKTIEPVIKPLGYDWKIGIALLTSFAAREVFVGTMSTIYSVEAADDDPKKLRDKLRAEINPNTGEPVYSMATIISLLLFYAFAMQCMATLAVVKRETKSWKWPIIQLTYLSVLAYLSSFLAFQLLH